jgi:dTDP-4-amino-4,6-dideoxygalactose transaminase
MDYTIPFNKPTLTGDEFAYISMAIKNELHISGDGAYTKKCHALLEQMLGVSKALLTTSCTHALEMAAILLDVHEGDEVIVPSFTFVSTVNAFVLRGARPVFADVRPDTLNLDECRLEALITPRTKAIVPVHYAGVACEMDVDHGGCGSAWRCSCRGQRPRPAGEVPRALHGHVWRHGNPELSRDQKLHQR